MINVVDRKSKYPGRVKLIPVDGQPGVYDMIRADEPTVQGTVINKELFDSITATDVGALPIIDARGANYDMDAIFTNGEHHAIYKTNSVTLGTPYKKGVTVSANADILSYANAGGHGLQVAYMAGNIPYMRTLVKGAISNWTTGYLPLVGGTVSGSLILDSGTASSLYNSFRTINGTNYAARFWCGASGEVAIDKYNRDTYTTEASFSIDASGMRYKRGDVTNTVLHTGNKPSGSYVGNGNASARNIVVEGIGMAVMVKSTSSTAIVTSTGAIVWSGESVTSVGTDQCYYSESTRTLALKTTLSQLNASDTTYWYSLI